MTEKYGIEPKIYGHKEEELHFVTNEITELTKLKIAYIDITIKPSACHTRGHVLYYMEVG